MARLVVPLEIRRFLRRAAIEAPRRLRDLPADILSRFSPPSPDGPMPPGKLRARVGQSSRATFSEVGRMGCAQIVAAFERVRDPRAEYASWLDFGCGCGRLARHVGRVSGLFESLHGVDVDPALIDWASRNLPGTYAVMNPHPPLSFGASSFDVVYAISIFTHCTEQEQGEWLAELHRILRPGGLLIATTLSTGRTSDFSLAAEVSEGLDRRGFACANPTGAFNERAAFHSERYLKETWGRFFATRLHEKKGFVGYQDLSVWEKAGPRRCPIHIPGR
jgi:SAM-dependent methyltransferase